MSKKKKDGREATKNTVKTHIGRWVDGPVSVKVQGIGDGSKEGYCIRQDQDILSQYEVIDLHEFTKSDRPCISFIEGNDGCLRLVVVTAFKPSEGERDTEHMLNRIASDLFKEASGEDEVHIYGDALFIPPMWIHHYPDVMYAYLQGQMGQGVWKPSDIDGDDEL